MAARRVKLPAFQFYPGDWLRDAGLRACTIAARGIWVDLICFMHDSPVRGYLLKSNGQAFTEPELARAIGCTLPMLKKCLAELESAGVYDRNESGIIYSRRMASDEQARLKATETGSLGGNPQLGRDSHERGYLYVMSRADGLHKLGISTNPDKRAYQLRKSSRDSSIRVLMKFLVPDMGEAEDFVHRQYQAKKVIGEWFRLDESDLSQLANWQGMAEANGPFASPSPECEQDANDRRIPTPSSSSSSSSASSTSEEGRQKTASDPKPSKTPTRTKAKPPTAETVRRFEEFWSAYPRKANRAEALDAFAELNPSPELLAEILAALAEQKTWSQWTRDGGEFIPYPATWIQKKRWYDQPPEVLSPGPNDVIASPGDDLAEMRKLASKLGYGVGVDAEVRP